MTTEDIKALEAKAKAAMLRVSIAEELLQEKVSIAMAAIKAYHQALGIELNTDTNLCIIEGCPEVGTFEMHTGDYICERHYTP